jgi:putative DNA primase/helicase
MLANGTGKARARRDGGARAVTTWRNLVLSTGEQSLTDKIAETTGKRARAGQEVRVVNVPADAGEGHGVFDNLHDFASGAALSDHLRRASEAHSGHAARAFLEKLTGNLAATVETLRGVMAKWLKAKVPPDADGQVRRVAGRFALVAAAGELATALGILPWPAGEASAAAARCFDDWLAARGDTGPQEITAGIRQVRAFLEMYGASRFEEPWPRNVGGSSVDHERRPIIRAGFRKQDQDGNWEYYIQREAWRDELCKGFDPKAIAKAMIAKGWMKRGEGVHLAPKVEVRNNGTPRLYRISSGFLAGDEP